MPKNVRAANKRGAALSEAAALWFLYWLEREGCPKAAAEKAGRSYSAFEKKRQRAPRFKAAWDAALKMRILAREEEMFSNMAANGGLPQPAYLAAGLTRGWFYRRMAADPAFRARVEAAKGGALQETLKVALERAKDDNVLLWRLVERLGRGLLPPGKGSG